MKSSSLSVLAYLRSVVAPHGAAREEDRELLRRLVEQRDEEAFTALLQRHGPMVLGLARRVTGNEQTAEDVFQAVFVWLFRKGHTIRRPQSLSCWLHGVAHRLALQARRAHGRRRQREVLTHPSSPPNPLDELTAQEFLAALDGELAKLPEKYRAPLILCCLEGLSQEEAARRLGCSAGAVRGRLERGRQRLRMRLEKRGLALPAVLGGTLLLGGVTSPISAALAQATLQATTGGNAAPAVAALLEEATRNMFIHKLKAIGAAVMLLAVAGTGVGMMTLHPQAAKENTPLAATSDKPLSAKRIVDLYGDPLPKGAVLRLGTLQRRAVGATLAVSSDGKSIVGVRRGKRIHIWDAVTGELRQTRELPGDPSSPAVLSKDGCWLARTMYSPERLEIWDVQHGQKVRELTIKGTAKVVAIGSFALSADAKRIAAVGRGRPKDPRSNAIPSEHLIRAWDLADGKEIFDKDVRNDTYNGVIALTPDGKRLLASFTSTQEGLYCWDIATGKKLWQHKQFGSSVSIEFTPDGKVLAPGLRQQKLDLATGKTEPIVGQPPIKGDRRLTLTPDGRTLLISTAEGVIVWDLVLGKELRKLPGAGEEVVVTPDGKTAITNDGTLQRWDLATGQAAWSNTAELGHIGEVTAVKFSMDGKRLVSASTDGTVRLWDTTTGRTLRIWHGHATRRTGGFFGRAVANLLDISADGRRVASAGADAIIKLWDISSNKELRTLTLPPAEKGVMNRRFYHVRISPDGRRITGFFGPSGGYAIVGQPLPKLTDKLAAWDADTGTLLELLAVERSGGGILSPDERTLLTRNKLMDVKTAKTIELPGLSWNDTPGEFSRDGALFAGQAQELRRQNGRDVYWPAGLRVWETATGKIVARVKTKPWIAQTVFHPDNRFIVSNGMDFTNNPDGIHIHDVRSGEVVARFMMPEAIRSSLTPGSFAGCLAFTRDGRRMATGHPDSTILIWDVHLPGVSVTPLSAKELEACWAVLTDADAAKAWEAVGRLVESPKETLAFLRGRIKPFPTAAADVTRKLLADLDSDSFEKRETAVKRMKELGLQAEPALRSALKDNPSLEQRRRIEILLAALPGAQPPPLAEELRQLRALIVLERIGTPEGRRILEEVAKGPESARLTRQAQAALMCLP